MSLVPTLLCTAAGVALIGVALRDVFDVLFHLEGRGDLSRAIGRAVWRVMHRIADARPRAFPLAGPIGLLAVIGVWTLLIITGWALLLWPHVSSFHDSGGEPAQGGFFEALHLSVVALSTLGYGDVAPTEQWLRIVGPFEALIGFGLLTASISWLLAVHPAVLRRRSLAYELWLLRQGGDSDEDPPELDAGLLADLTSRVIVIERDLVAMPATYYFAELDERFSLAAELPDLRELAQRAAGEATDAAARQRARMLNAAIDDLLLTVGGRLHRLESVDADAALEAFCKDHVRRARSVR